MARLRLLVGTRKGALILTAHGTHARRHATGSAWQPGAGGLCLHTVIADPVNGNRLPDRRRHRRRVKRRKPAFFHHCNTRPAGLAIDPPP